VRASDQIRISVAIILLIASGPFVIPAVQWGTLGMLRLVAWAAIAGLAAYPLASLWRRLMQNRHHGP
jgi:hypothetical protein